MSSEIRTEIDKLLENETQIRGWLLMKIGSPKTKWPDRVVITKSGYVAWLFVITSNPSYDQHDNLDELRGVSQDARFVYSPDDVEDVLVELDNIEYNKNNFGYGE